MLIFVSLCSSLDIRLLHDQACLRQTQDKPFFQVAFYFIAFETISLSSFTTQQSIFGVSLNYIINFHAQSSFQTSIISHIKLSLYTLFKSISKILLRLFFFVRQIMMSDQFSKFNSLFAPLPQGQKMMNKFLVDLFKILDKAMMFLLFLLFSILHFIFEIDRNCCGSIDLLANHIIRSSNLCMGVQILLLGNSQMFFGEFPALFDLQSNQMDDF